MRYPSRKLPQYRVLSVAIGCLDSEHSKLSIYFFLNMKCFVYLEWHRNEIARGGD
jgi:hypothetical protein